MHAAKIGPAFASTVCTAISRIVVGPSSSTPSAWWRAFPATSNPFVTAAPAGVNWAAIVAPLPMTRSSLPSFTGTSRAQLLQLLQPLRDLRQRGIDHLVTPHRSRKHHVAQVFPDTAGPVVSRSLLQLPPLHIG